MNRQKTAFLILAGALAAAFLGQVFIFNPNYTPPFLKAFYYWLTTINVMMHKNLEKGLLFFAFAAALALLARFIGGRKDETQAMNPRVETVLFLIIIVISAGLRFYRLAELPPGAYVEPSAYALDAIEIMKGNPVEGEKFPVYFTRGVENAAAFTYMQAAMFKVFGVGMAQAKAVTSITGVLCVAALYFLLRYMWGARAAVMGGLLFAFMRWHIDFSRMGKHAVLSTFVIIIVLYFLMRAYRERKWQDFILLGISTALSLYSYSVGRFVPVWMIACFIYLAVKDISFIKQNAMKLGAAFIVALIVAGPMIGYIAKYPDKYFGRGRGITVFNKAAVAGMSFGKMSQLQVVAENTANTLLAFNRHGEGFPGHNTPGYPLLSFIGGIFGLLGLALLVFELFNPMPFFILSGFFTALLPNFITIDWTVAIRSVMAMPFAIILCVAFLEYLLNSGRDAFGPKAAPVLLLLLVPAFAHIALSETDAYFVKKMYRTGTEHSIAEKEMAVHIKKLGPGWKAIVLEPTARSDSFRFTMYPLENYEVFSFAKHLPDPAPGKDGIVYIFPEYFKQYIPVLRDIYPEGKFAEVSDEKYGNGPLYVAYEVDAQSAVKNAERMKRHGLRVKYYRTENMQGVAAAERVEPLVLINGVRIEELYGPPYSAIWKGSIFLPETGLYKFRISTNGKSAVTIAGKRIIDFEQKENYVFPLEKEAGIELERGSYPIEVTYTEEWKHFNIELLWEKPGDKEFSVVPPSAFRP